MQREWQGRYGRRWVEGTNSIGQLVVRTEGLRSAEMIEPGFLDRQVLIDESQAKTRHEREASEREESIKRESAKAERYDLHGFTDGMTRLQAGRAATALAKHVINKGRVITVRKLIEEMVDSGATVDHSHKLRWLIRPDDTFVDEKQISKIGMNYAEHLIGLHE